MSFRDHRIEFVTVSLCRARANPSTRYDHEVVLGSARFAARVQIVSAAGIPQEVLPAEVLTGVRGRATGHAGVLEVAGRRGEVVCGLDAPIRYRSLPRGRYLS